jgi:hypothetical protein
MLKNLLKYIRYTASKQRVTTGEQWHNMFEMQELKEVTFETTAILHTYHKMFAKSKLQ